MLWWLIVYGARGRPCDPQGPHLDVAISSLAFWARCSASGALTWGPPLVGRGSVRIAPSWGDGRHAGGFHLFPAGRRIAGTGFHGYGAGYTVATSSSFPVVPTHVSRRQGGTPGSGAACPARSLGARMATGCWRQPGQKMPAQELAGAMAGSSTRYQSRWHKATTLPSILAVTAPYFRW